MSYAAISIEGGLFPPDLVEQIAAADNSVGGQTARDFGLAANQRLSDEIQSSFADARSYWDSFNRRLERSRESRATLTREDWATKLFELLGFPSLQRQRAAIEAGGVSFPVSHRAHAGENATPIHIIAVDQELDQRGAQRRTPHALIQDYLNRSESLWGMATNGAKLRLLRDSARLSKPTYLEFDLRAMIEGNAYSEFAVLYRLLHATRFPREGVDPHECLLEGYYNQGIEAGGRVRGKLRDGVKSALETLGAALVKHPGNGALREKFSNGQLDERGYYRQLLNFVYRMLFLMVTEERELLFTESNPESRATYEIYERYYSIASLRERAERRSDGDDHVDLWKGLAQTFRLFRNEEAAGKLGVSPLNGELFGLLACRDIEAALCPNKSLLKVVRCLSTFDDGGVRRRVNYAHLDVEEFGSVYESLLDYRPVVADVSGDQPRFCLAAGTERKQTGSYYTPPELVRELIESALVPVIDQRLAQAKTPADKESALLSLRVCDPASGSGHFLLAAARRIARELARVRSGDDEPVPGVYRAAIRDVMRNCIYAVDKNPLAVDLCKVALWIESHATGMPLGFLDHHIKCGDSLVGVCDTAVLTKGIPDDAYKRPVADEDTKATGDAKKAAAVYRQRNRQDRRGQQRMTLAPPELPTALGKDFIAFSELEEHTVAEVAAKASLYAQLRGRDTHWWDRKIACDLWTYAFFAPIQLAGANGLDPTPTTGNVHNALRGSRVDQTLQGQAIVASHVHPFFHWPLEFPEVFERERGGFDVVLGNPPWERIELQEKEFFAARDHEIADAPNKAARERLIRALTERNPALAKEFRQAVHDSESSSRFVRGSERFPLTGRGDVNTYSIFAETARSICRPTGRVGMIVPSGIATDDTTKAFFADLANTNSLVSLYDFENRDGVFPGVHRSYKFCLLTMTGADWPSPCAEFAFFLHRTEQLQDAKRRFTLTPADFALFNPNTRNCPIFRTRRDADIAAKMYRRAGIFVREEGGNPWGVRFHSMFHMSNDSHLFRTREELAGSGWRLEGNVFVKGWGDALQRCLPLYEAKLFHQYDHRFATFDGVDDRALRSGNARELSSADKADPETVIIPRYWVPEEEVDRRHRRLDKGEIGAIVSQPASQLTHSTSWQSWLATPAQANLKSNGPANGDLRHDPGNWSRQFLNPDQRWLLAFRDIARPTDQRTSIFTVVRAVAMSKAQLIHVEYADWLQVFRDITNATNERTVVMHNVPQAGVGHSASLLTYETAKAVASALVMANMNSLPLDWAARLSVGGVHMSFFIVRQLPVLPPEAYLEDAPEGLKWVELVVPKVLELTYTAYDMEPFARDLGYDGPPFPWDDDRRHRLRCELDAIYARMYQLDRTDLEWILDAEEPSQSFPGLKRNEMSQFGEYRTQRYVLQAYDQLARGELPGLAAESLSTGG